LSPSDHEEGSKGRSSSPQEGDEGKEGIRVSDHWSQWTVSIPDRLY
jgi:hypothetical protein